MTIPQTNDFGSGYTNQLFEDTDDNHMKRRDSTGALKDYDLQTIQQQSGAPTGSPTGNGLAYDTTGFVLYYWTGSAWRLVGA